MTRVEQRVLREAESRRDRYACSLKVDMTYMFGNTFSTNYYFDSENDSAYTHFYSIIVDREPEIESVVLKITKL
jgi:hypothetical protein